MSTELIGLLHDNTVYGIKDFFLVRCSSELKCKMSFGVYLPPQSELGSVPVIYWLSGTRGLYIDASLSMLRTAEQIHGIFRMKIYG